MHLRRDVNWVFEVMDEVAAFLQANSMPESSLIVAGARKQLQQHSEMSQPVLVVGDGPTGADSKVIRFSVVSRARH